MKGILNVKLTPMWDGFSRGISGIQIPMVVGVCGTSCRRRVGCVRRIICATSRYWWRRPVQGRVRHPAPASVVVTIWPARSRSRCVCIPSSLFLRAFRVVRETARHRVDVTRRADNMMTVCAVSLFQVTIVFVSFRFVSQRRRPCFSSAHSYQCRRVHYTAARPPLYSADTQTICTPGP